MSTLSLITISSSSLTEILPYRGLFLQEVKKECYAAAYVPAARCNMQNKASRATLLKAGFQVCGFMLIGEVN